MLTIERTHLNIFWFKHKDLK